MFVAALNGAALGGGLELALACDLRVAAEHAEVGLARGGARRSSPAEAATARLPRAIGAARAKELILTARGSPRAEALSWGLVSRVAPLAGLREAALELARLVARNAPISLRQAKRAVTEGIGMPLDAALDLENRLYQDCIPTADRREALAAFAEKRAPVFKGE